MAARKRAARWDSVMLVSLLANPLSSGGDTRVNRAPEFEEQGVLVVVGLVNILNLWRLVENWMKGKTELWCVDVGALAGARSR